MRLHVVYEETGLALGAGSLLTDSTSNVRAPLGRGAVPTPIVGSIGVGTSHLPRRGPHPLWEPVLVPSARPSSPGHSADQERRPRRRSMPRWRGRARPYARPGNGWRSPDRRAGAVAGGLAVRDGLS